MPVQCTGPCSCEQQTLHLHQWIAACQGCRTVVPCWAGRQLQPGQLRVTAWCRFAWIHCQLRQLTSKHQPTASSLDQNAIVKLSPGGAPGQPCTQLVVVQPCTAHPLCRPHSHCSGGVPLVRCCHAPAGSWCRRRQLTSQVQHLRPVHLLRLRHICGKVLPVQPARQEHVGQGRQEHHMQSQAASGGGRPAHHSSVLPSTSCSLSM